MISGVFVPSALASPRLYPEVYALSTEKENAHIIHSQEEVLESTGDDYYRCRKCDSGKVRCPTCGKLVCIRGNILDYVDGTFSPRHHKIAFSSILDVSKGFDPKIEHVVLQHGLGIICLRK